MKGTLRERESDLVTLKEVVRCIALRFSAVANIINSKMKWKLSIKASK